MKFSTRADIEAPIDFVFDRVTDFAGYERAALRRGAQVQRVDASSAARVGARWEASFVYRGRKRDLNVTVTELDPPHALKAASTMSGIEGATEVELVPLSRQRTRLVFAQELKPTSLAARLMIQSLKLAKGTLDKRFKERVRDYAADIEGRWRRDGAGR